MVDTKKLAQRLSKMEGFSDVQASTNAIRFRYWNDGFILYITGDRVTLKDAYGYTIGARRILYGTIPTDWITGLLYDPYDAGAGMRRRI